MQLKYVKLFTVCMSGKVKLKKKNTFFLRNPSLFKSETHLCKMAFLVEGVCDLQNIRLVENFLVFRFGFLAFFVIQRICLCIWQEFAAFRMFILLSRVEQTLLLFVQHLAPRIL